MNQALVTLYSRVSQDNHTLFLKELSYHDEEAAVLYRFGI